MSTSSPHIATLMNASGAPTSSPRVLIVEDEPKLGALLQRALQEEGMRPDLVSSGEEALAQMEQALYDALVIDVLLPGMDGLETCRRLRRSGLRVPVIIMSAREDLREGDLVEAGAHDLLRKPFALDDLLARLEGAERLGPGAR